MDRGQDWEFTPPKDTFTRVNGRMENRTEKELFNTKIRTDIGEIGRMEKSMDLDNFILSTAITIKESGNLEKRKEMEFRLGHLKKETGMKVN